MRRHVLLYLFPLPSPSLVFPLSPSPARAIAPGFANPFVLLSLVPFIFFGRTLLLGMGSCNRIHRSIFGIFVNNRGFAGENPMERLIGQSGDHVPLLTVGGVSPNRGVRAVRDFYFVLAASGVSI